MSRFNQIRAARFCVWSLILSSLLTTVFFGAKFWVTGSGEFANAYAGASAVLAACISAIVAFRSAEIAEEAQKPYPYPYIDTQSRYQLILLKLKNVGGSPAHDVYIEWNNKARPECQGNGEEGNPTTFATGRENAVKVLMPGEAQTSMLGVSHWVAGNIRNAENEWSGLVRFRDSKGNQHKHTFIIDRSIFAWGLNDETEQIKALHSMTRVPDLLEKINKSIGKLERKSD
jgi:hypothetical protein